MDAVREDVVSRMVSSGIEGFKKEGCNYHEAQEIIHRLQAIVVERYKPLTTEVLLKPIP